MMVMTVVLTEKPDVAKHVAEFFGIAERLDGAYVTKNGYYVTNNIGRMLHTGNPEDYMDESQKAARGFAQLPIIPHKFKRFPNEDTKKQFNVVMKLLKKADVIVNAGDIDRMGQLISDEMFAYAGIDPNGKDKPIKRVLIRANNHDSLKAAFDPANIRSNGEASFVNCRYAGEARDESDWLIGMNGSRAVRAAINAYMKNGISVGRVQTPTLGLVVQRELLIRNFKSVTYFVPEVVLPDGRILTWEARKEDADMRGIDEEGRIIDRAVAEAIVERIRKGLEGVVTLFEENNREQAPPLPFSYSKLQSEMSARYGMSIAETRRASTALYESKKMITYVGTDCQHLPTSMHEEAPKVLKGLSDRYQKVASGANPDIKYGCWNDAKVTAHHAIIPTGEMAGSLTDSEQKVFDVIARRYMAQFYPKHKYLETNLEAEYGQDVFKSGWRETTVLGWKEVDQQADEDGVDGDGQAEKKALKMKSK